MFAANGLVLGAYAGSLPTLREHLDLTHPMQIPAVLLVVGLFGILGMQIGGRATERNGPRTVGLAGFAPLTVGALLFGLSPNYATSLAAGALIGVGNGLLDVAMNAFGVRVEQGFGGAVMSRLHALWSLGNAIGAGVVLVAGRLVDAAPGVLLSLALTTAAAIALVTGLALARWCPPTPPEPSAGAADGRGRIPPVAWLLGAMAIAFGLAEGTAYDWSAILITDVAGVSPDVGAVGLTVTASAMVVIRLLGDWLVDRFGRRAVVRFGGGCAAAGYAILTFSTPLPALLIGWAMVGLGVGMIAPQVYAVAGHRGGPRGLALVVTFGYATFLAGPAVMGALIGVVGIQPAMVAPATMCLALLLLARGMPNPARSADRHSA
ncbi:MFS transporter [Granulicoccus sp. GXG6511]|uniref:MFS transporter n=1 Tax=Granulicoccus sp. GXG6511 TaxID=3381351 RepID=UPI003D7C74BE